MSVLFAVFAVCLFNWFLVTPRYTFQVSWQQDVILLVTTLCSSTLTSFLTSRLRLQASLEQTRAKRAEHLQQLAKVLQAAPETSALADAAQQWLHTHLGWSVHIWLTAHQPPSPGHPSHRVWQAAQAETGPIGAGTGRYTEFNQLAFGLFSGAHRWGTLIAETQPASTHLLDAATLKPFVRLIGDEGAQLDARLATQQARDALESQHLRNALLTAIAHDHRTPLATITSAASSLLETDMTPAAQQMAETVLAEAAYLHRLTTNTLDLARLDSPGLLLKTNWESVEELVGAALLASKRRHPLRVVTSAIDTGLPLIQCDGMLWTQLLDNLLENALRYSPAHAPVQVRACAVPPHVLVSVWDEGPGIPDKQMAPSLPVRPNDSNGGSRGLGLALCHAIAKVHGATLLCRDRPEGGTVLEIRWPLPENPPALPPEPGDT